MTEKPEPCDAAQLDILERDIRGKQITTLDQCDAIMERLDSEREALGLEISDMTLNGAPADLADKAWLVTARADHRRAGLLRNRVQQLRGTLRRHEQAKEAAERDKRFTSAFIRLCRTKLPAETYRLLVEDTRELIGESRTK